MKRILAVIVISQFLCTSLWFAGNAILPDIVQVLRLDQDFVAHLTSMVQFGFVIGTLIFAILTIADRFSPSLVFFLSSMIAALFNLAISLDGINSIEVLFCRFFTGFFLAGIYPVGMKIASDYYDKGLGKSLGYLVGALVLGTGFPHLLKNLTAQLSWKYVVYSTSALAFTGGLAMWLLVPNGPFRTPGQKLNLGTFIIGFKIKKFRAAAFGYFGHMWELYAFWAFVPIMLKSYIAVYPQVKLNVSLWSFLIIASGGLACVAGGYLSQYLGVKRTAIASLLLSCMCCLVSPLFLFVSSVPLLLTFLFFWGVVVIADSPLFSTLVAQNAPEMSRGTSLTIVNCIGFSITILSIQLIHALTGTMSAKYIFMILALGPVLGLMALREDTVRQ